MYYIQKGDLKLVIILALIYIHWKENLIPQKKKPQSKSKLNPGKEAKRWPTVAKRFLVEILIGIKLTSK
jgi:hypothetical protein